MNLARDDIEHIEWLIKKMITEAADAAYSREHNEFDQRERLIRVEEELKHQRELMLEGFKQMEKRFEQVDRRFEQVDKRFEQMHLDMNKRFEAVDKRFDQQHQEIMGLHNEIKVLMRWGFGFATHAPDWAWMSEDLTVPVAASLPLY
jgi:hypothetical protein